MSDPSKTFWKRLAESGLLSAGQLAEWKAKFEKLETDGTPSDPRAIAKQLIRRQLLTQFQAKTLLKGLKLPLVWDDYRLLEPIEDGPFGHYYAATHIPTGHRVALRLIPASEWPKGTDPQQVRRVIEAARSVTQGNVLRTYELLERDKWFALVLDPVSGQRMSERLRSQRRLGSPEAASCVFQLAQALAAWHEQGLVHGDVQPSSVIVNHDGQVQLWRDPFYTLIPFFQASGSGLTDLQDRASLSRP